jgi:hypothetical protein
MEAVLSLRCLKRTAFLLIVVMGLLSGVPRVEAGFVPSGLIESGQAGRVQDAAAVQKVLENRMVSERLATLGYDRSEIDARLSRLSDAEMHSLATQLDSLAPGGDVVGLVIGILVIVLLIVVIVKLMDKTIVVR